MGVYRKFCARLSVLFMLVMTAVTLYTLIANPTPTAVASVMRSS